MTTTTNSTNSLTVLEEYDDLMCKIGYMESLVDCAEMLVRHTDSLNFDNPAVRLEHTNCMLALIDGMSLKIKSIWDHAERLYAMIPTPK